MIIAFKEGVFFLFTIKFQMLYVAHLYYIFPPGLYKGKTFFVEKIYTENLIGFFLFERGVLKKINLSYEREFDSFFWRGLNVD